MAEIRYKVWYKVLVFGRDWPSILDEYRVLRTPGDELIRDVRFPISDLFLLVCLCH